MFLVRRYKRASADFVYPDNLLVKILFGLGLNTMLDFDRFNYAVADRMYGLAQSLRLTSIATVGDVHRKTIMPAGDEFFLIHNTPYEPADWHDLRPIEFLYHNQTNLDYRLGTADDNAIAFISINVPMLAYQYIEWFKEQSTHESTQSTYNFLDIYAIGNALESYMDISAFNQYYSRLSGNPIPDTRPFNKVALANVDNYINKMMINIMAKITQRRNSAAEVLANTPLLFKDTALELMNVPDLPKTNNVNWFLTTALLPYVTYAVWMSGSTGYSLETGRLSSLKRDITNLRNTKFLGKLAPRASVHIMEEIYDPFYALMSELEVN